MKIEKHEKECRAIRLLPGNPKMETMKITNPLESHNWMQYQRQTADFFSELGCFAKVEAVVEGIRAKHKIDVWVKFQRYGIECKWVIECKY
ncbi:MAG: hypothetical protein QG657_5241, partial [Acidobacteriota bacterium]|nr:hypothetical protein [Acidobacteriota bacterium]